MKTRVFATALVIGLLPIATSAHIVDGKDTHAVEAAEIATAPVGTVGPQASELASFTLAAAALVVAGIALARTKKHSHEAHQAHSSM